MCRAARSLRRILPALTPVAAFLLPACTALYDDRCGPEGRDVTSIAIIPTPAGDSMGLAVISMGETPGSEPQRSASWDIMSVTLLGHIQNARLVASEDTSSVLRPLPGVSGGDDVALRGQADPYVGPPAFGELFQRAAAERLTLVLSTDIPARPVIVLPLQVLQFNDWGRAHCS